MQFTRKMEGQFAVGPETDNVVAHVPVPAGGTLEQVWFDCAISAGHVDVNDAVMYGVTGMMVRDPDPDTVDTINDTWDRMVPKDKVNTTEIDTDTLGEDTSAEFEPGHVELEAAFDIDQMGNLEFFRKRSRISYAQSPFGFVDGSPDLYTPIDYFKTHKKIMRTVEAPSIAMIGFSSPGMGVTTATVASTPIDHEWQMLQWLEVFLYDHWKNLIGLTETGAETPYVDATNFITELIEPAVHEVTTGAYLGTTFLVYCGATWQVSVPGEPGAMSLTGG